MLHAHGANALHSVLLIDHNNAHTESYNRFLSTYLRQTIAEAKPCVHVPQQGSGTKVLVPGTTFRFTRVRIGTPPISIDVALAEGRSYTIPIYASLHIQTTPPKDTEQLAEDVRVFHDVKLCDMPLMSMSAECLNAKTQNTVTNRHPPGVFVIGGNLRYLPLTRTARTNYAMTTNTKANHWIVQVRSRCSAEPARSTATLEISMVWSTSKSTPAIRVKLPYTDGKLSVAAVIVALDVHFGQWLDTFRREIQLLDSRCLDQSICQVLREQYQEIQERAAARNEREKSSLREVAAEMVCTSSTTKSPVDVIISRDIMPHLSQREGKEPGTTEEFLSRRAKADYLAHCLAVLCATSIGRIAVTDRDDLAQVRCMLPGQNLSVLFRMQFTAQLRRVVQLYRRSIQSGHIERADQVYRDQRLSSGLASAMATGNWSPRRQAVTHPFLSKNLSIQISQLARVSSSKPCLSGKQTAPRSLKGSAFGYLCAAETPDGDQVGLVCPLASLARVSPDLYSPHTDALVLFHFRTLLDSESGPKPGTGSVCDPIFFRVVNTSGGHMGTTIQPDAILRHLQTLRTGNFSPLSPYLTASIDHSRKEVVFHGEEGRFLRPLVRVQDIHLLAQTLQDTEKTRHSVRTAAILSCVQFVCPAMMRSLTVCPDLRLLGPLHTHVEISHTACLGRLTMRLPMLLHNQGPRTIYGSGLIKSSIPSTECGPTSHARSRLWYSERELVHTRASRHDQSHLLSDGINLMIAVLPLSTNPEDALVINRAAVDRGLLSSEEYKVYTHCIAHKEANNFRFACPAPNTPGRRCTSYTHLESNGLPKVGSIVGPGSVLIGRISLRRGTGAGWGASSEDGANESPHVSSADLEASVKETKSKRRRVGSIKSDTSHGPADQSAHQSDHKVRRAPESEFDTSLCLGEYEHGRVTRAEISVQAHATVATVELIRAMHIQPGDKLASRHSQKGVVGQLREDVDMPFSIEDGTRPDVIVSPYCFPSRMTSGKLLEVLRGAAALATLDDDAYCIDEQDCFVPGEDAIQHTKDALKRAGYSPSGTQRFVDGQTGAMIEAAVFCGTAFYSKQDHLATNKARARGMGATQILTGQPCEGRKRGGGLKMGPMELGVLQAHGATTLLHERALRMCAPFETPICEICGHVAENVAGIEYARCRGCAKAGCVSTVELSKTSLLVIRELASTGVDVTLGV